MNEPCYYTIAVFQIYQFLMEQKESSVYFAPKPVVGPNNAALNLLAKKPPVPRRKKLFGSMVLYCSLNRGRKVFLGSVCSMIHQSSLEFACDSQLVLDVSFGLEREFRVRGMQCLLL